MKCKREIKKKKNHLEQRISYNLENGSRKIIKISIQFYYEREIFRAISETYSIQRNPFNSQRAYFIGNTLEKFHQDLRFHKTFTKLPAKKTSFTIVQTKFFLNLSLSFSLQISTRHKSFFFTYPQRYNREGKDLRRDLPITEISFRWRETDYITTSRG